MYLEDMTPRNEALEGIKDLHNESSRAGALHLGCKEGALLCHLA